MNAHSGVRVFKGLVAIAALLCVSASWQDVRLPPKAAERPVGHCALEGISEKRKAVFEALPSPTDGRRAALLCVHKRSLSDNALARVMAPSGSGADAA